MKALKMASLFLLAPMLYASINVNVLSYGAKGDGVTDDTAAIQNASTAVAKGGGLLYFPAGTYMINPARGHVVLGSNMTVEGPGVIKVEPNIGNFQYVMGPNPVWETISNVTIENITVDENVLNNPSTVTAASEPQVIVLGFAFTNLTLSGVTFDSSGTWAVKVTDKLTMKNSRITFQNRTQNPWYDNSAIYLAASHSTCSITGNTFEGTNTSANTAIEVHNTQNCTISGNRFDSYRVAVLPFDTYSLTFTGNTITRANQAIYIYGSTIAEGITISNNTISVNNLDRQSNAAWAIALWWCSSCTPVPSFSNITITDNNISFQREVRENVAASGTYAIGIMPAGSVDYVTISGNTITNAPIRGITIGNNFRSNTVSNVVVENNTLISPGTNIDKTYSLAGIALQGRLDNVTVRDNIIKNEWTPFTGRYGLYSDSSGSYTSVSVYGNQIDSAYTNYLSSTISQ